MGKKSSVAFEPGDYLSPRYWPSWCMLGLLRLSALLPYRAAITLGRGYGRLIGWLLPSRNRIVDTNLARCFPDKPAAERARIKADCFGNLGVSLIEAALCWWWPDEKLRNLVEIRGREHLDAVLDNGRGAILLTGHFTSLEIGARLLALFMPVQVMYRTQGNEMLDSYLYTRRSRYFVNTVSRKKSRKLIRGIRNRIPTWYAPDQDFRRERNVFAPFMGIATATITASSRLAQAAGAAMLPFYPERKADGSGYILHIDAPLEDFPSGDDLVEQQ